MTLRTSRVRHRLLPSPQPCYLVRHAQTSWNAENRLQGHSDLPLNPRGRRQAQCAGAYFATRRVQVLYTSHLTRSLQTAQAIGRSLRVEPRVEPSLAEMHLGAWEGLTPDEIDARFDGAYQRWRVTPSQVQIPDAEATGTFRHRVRKTFHTIMAAHPEDTVVIVSHGGVIAALFAEWLSADYDRLLHRLTLDNAGISAIDRRTHPPHILWVNHTAHLVDAPAAAGGRGEDATLSSLDGLSSRA